jgi:hypothetical protein
LRELAEDAASCTRCDLYLRATATVFGEGRADAGMVTTSRGLMTSSSASNQKPQALISVVFGRWWIRRFPRSVHLKCLTALVT